MRRIRQSLLVLIVSLCPMLAACAEEKRENCHIGLWKRGVSITAPDDPGMTVYLWFYEWNVFNAFVPMRQSPGPEVLKMELLDDGAGAKLEAPGVVLTVESDAEGASLTLRITNITDQAWPEAAGIIPCLSPGDPPEVEVKKNPRLVDADQTRTWFVGKDAPQTLVARDLHFNPAVMDNVRARAPEGLTDLFPKWPVSNVNASAGLLIRQSSDEKWIAGIAWDDFVFVQGHNPWKCMHVCAKVGPLAPGESRTIHGRIVLLRATREEALRKLSQPPGHK